MNKEKLAYGNISPVQIGGKTKYRFTYKGADNKVKYITSINRKKLTPLVIKKVEANGFKITDFGFWSIEQAHQLWLDRQVYKELQYGKPSKSCIKDYESFCNAHILPYFKGQDSRLIDKVSIKSFVKLLEDKKTISPRTLTKVFNVLSAILDESAAKEKIARNVCKDLNYLADVVIVEKQQPRLDFDVWSLHKVKELINNVDNKDIRLMFSIMLETACRPSEVRGLNRSHLQFKSNQPYLSITNAVKRDKSLGGTKTKTGTRDLVISSSLKDDIEKHLSKLPEKQNSLFLQNTGKYLCIETLIRALDKACNSLGVTLPINRKCYFFRHYMATYWAKEKKYTDPLDLANALGDKDVNFVSRTYIKPYANIEKEKEKSDWQNKQFNN